MLDDLTGGTYEELREMPKTELAGEVRHIDLAGEVSSA